MTLYRVTSQSGVVCYEEDADYLQYQPDGSVHLCNKRWWWFTDKVVATTLATDQVAAVTTEGEIRFP